MNVKLPTPVKAELLFSFCVTHLHKFNGGIVHRDLGAPVPVPAPVPPTDMTVPPLLGSTTPAALEDEDLRSGVILMRVLAISWRWLKCLKQMRSFWRPPSRSTSLSLTPK